jgi:hypothetical protein
MAKLAGDVGARVGVLYVVRVDDAVGAQGRGRVVAGAARRRYPTGTPRSVQTVSLVLDGSASGCGAFYYDAMLERLANAELRGSTLRILPQGGEEDTWRDALTTVVHGFNSSAAEPDHG